MISKDPPDDIQLFTSVSSWPVNANCGLLIIRTSYFSRLDVVRFPNDDGYNLSNVYARNTNSFRNVICV